jgi:hypothetical protein
VPYIVTKGSIALTTTRVTYPGLDIPKRHTPLSSSSSSPPRLPSSSTGNVGKEDGSTGTSEGGDDIIGAITGTGEADVADATERREGSLVTHPHVVKKSKRNTFIIVSASLYCLTSQKWTTKKKMRRSAGVKHPS